MVKLVVFPSPVKLSRTTTVPPPPPPEDVNEMFALPSTPGATVTCTEDVLIKLNAFAFVANVPLEEMAILDNVPPPPAATSNSIFALPSPESVTDIVTFAVFTKFSCLADKVDAPFCETRTVFAAEFAATYASFAVLRAVFACPYASLAVPRAVFACA